MTITELRAELQKRGYKKVSVPLVGEDGNAFGIIGRVSRALRQTGQQAFAPIYNAEATDGDYDHLLQVTLEFAGDEDDTENG